MPKPRAIVSIPNCPFNFLNLFSKMDQTEPYIGCVRPHTFWQASAAKNSTLLWFIGWLKKNLNVRRKCNVVEVREKNGLKVENKCKEFVYKQQLECMRIYALQSVPQSWKAQV